MQCRPVPWLKAGLHDDLLRGLDRCHVVDVLMCGYDLALDRVSELRPGALEHDVEVEQPASMPLAGQRDRLTNWPHRMRLGAM